MGIRYHVDVFDGVRDQFPIHACNHPFLMKTWTRKLRDRRLEADDEFEMILMICCLFFQMSPTVYRFA